MHNQFLKSGVTENYYLQIIKQMKSENYMYTYIQNTITSMLEKLCFYTLKI